MERIRPPYHPEDDTPFGGERWGCFWTFVWICGLLALALIARIFFHSYISWLFIIAIVAVIQQHVRKKYWK